MPPHNDEAHVPLVAGGDDASSCDDDHREGIPKTSAAPNNTVQRIFMIVILASLVAIAVVFQREFNQLNAELQQDEAKIMQLQDTVENQAVVIQRFNESVSNTDVLKQLQLMKDKLQQTQDDLEDELQKTNKQVTEKLDDTLLSLDATVQGAKAEIQDQVDTVKKDFEQYMIQTQDQFSMENSFMVYQLAGTFTLLSCLISMWHMTAHLRKLKQPVIQRKILAILWMSPIYAVTSWFSLVFHNAEGYLAIVKDAYEAYIIYQFLSFCIAVVGKGDRNAVVDLLAKHADHLTPPFRLFFCCGPRDPYENDRALADAILLQCQFFAMQFVLFRPLTTIANVFLTKYEYYGPWADGPHDWRAPQVYVTVIQNLSIFTAFAGLLKFYHALEENLSWCRPFAKFLCIKGVVFMTFWQGLAITILAETTDVASGDSDEWAKSAQNFLICLEMLLFSIAHFYCFPTEEWEENYQAKKRRANLGETIAFGDFVSDIKLILRSSGTSKKRKKKPQHEPTVPEEGDAELEEDTEEETSVASDITGLSSTDNNPNRALATAIARNLSDSDDPELQQARQRILESDLLNDLAFEPGTPEPENQSDPSELQTDSRSMDEDEGWKMSDHGNSTALGIPDAGPEDANERTGLLSGSESPPRLQNAENEEMLRPSLFTTLSAMGNTRPDHV